MARVQRQQAIPDSHGVTQGLALAHRVASIRAGVPASGLTHIHHVVVPMHCTTLVRRTTSALITITAFALVACADRNADGNKAVVSRDGASASAATRPGTTTTSAGQVATA